MGFATNFFGLWISDGNTLTRVSGITYGYITYVYGTLIHKFRFNSYEEQSSLATVKQIRVLCHIFILPNAII